MRARELAERRTNRQQLAGIAQNLGILHQTRAGQAGDPGERETWLRRAVDSVQDSLAIELEMNNRPGAAGSYSQLSMLYRLLGELDQAERNAQAALAIREDLGLPEVYKDYANLAEIARARGDAAAAAAWQAKYDAKVEELVRLRGGGGEAGSAEAAKAVVALAQATFQARAGGALPPDAAEVLAQMADAPAPFDALGAFLQAVAAGGPLPALPGALPDELREVLEALAEAVRENDAAG